MQKWDYKYVHINGDANKISIDGNEVASGKTVKVFPFIKQLGEEGWELVGMVSESRSKCVGGSVWSSEVWGGIFWYFKRPIS